MKKVKRLFFLVVSFLFFFSVSILAVVTDNSENLIIPAGESYTLDGTHSYSNSVQIYGTLYVTSYNGTGTTGKLELIAPTVTINSGGRIDVSGCGYAGMSGPGAGKTGNVGGSGGGGYGGLGGAGSQVAGGISYGSIVEPRDLGSGGGGSQGGSGGGVIRITVNGLLEVNGAIVSNGARGGLRGGGGSGGSIYITAGTFSGIGNISANGEGSGGWDSGGGGGGRIAIYYTTSLFTGKLEAKGGTGYQKGGAGTIFTKSPTQTYGELSIDNDNRSGVVTPLVDGIYNFDKVTVKGKAQLEISSGDNVTTSQLGIDGAVLTNAGNLTVSSDFTLDTNNGVLYHNSGSFNVGGNFQIGNTGTFYLNTQLTVWSLTISSGGVLTHTQGDTDFNLNVTGDLVVNSGGRIDVSGYGYLGSSGPGAGQGVWSLGGGGGYGGLGGNGREGLLGGIAYGSLIEPQDFGSGGGGSQGGSGGGVIRITVNGLLEVNGAIVSNGARGGPRGGGGSGGSIYITAGTFSGIGNISANGEGSGGWDSGGGGGGRIAIYYTTSLFTGKLEAKGGTGYQKGGDGTITFQPLTTESPISVTNLSETFSQDTSLSETLVTQKVTISNLSASGDLNGTVSFTNFEIISIKSGSFANKGFFRSNWTASLEGAQYKGYWEGISYLIPGERKIYLKGTIEGQIYGVVEGYLAESVSGSNIYDLYNATWSFNQVGNQLVSGKTNLSGTLTYQETIEYPSTQIYFLQTSIEGTASGHYTGPLNTVLTHLRIKDTNNPYNGEGFSIISYISDFGSGQGWTYAKTTSESSVKMDGLFSKPLFGLVSAILDEGKTPKTLSITTTRLDIGLPPEPDLKVRIWGPDRASPGQTVSYIVEVKNEGLKSAENITIVAKAPEKSSFISASENYILYHITDDEWISETQFIYIPYIRWDLPVTPAKSTKTLNFQVKLNWGLPQNMQMGSTLYTLGTDKANEIFSTFDPYGDRDENNPE